MRRPTLPAEVERLLEEHAFSEVRSEVGGLLVGTLDDDGATLTAALPALEAEAGQTHVTFTHEVWERALTELDRDHAGYRIVGWYHTHPGFGLFLSEYDRFVHEEFFSDPRMVALVVDPLAGDRGWFRSEGGELRLVHQEPTARAALPAPGLAAAPRRASAARVPALLAVPALLLVGAIAGYAFAGSTEPDGRPAAVAGVPSPPAQPVPTFAPPVPTFAPPVPTAPPAEAPPSAAPADAPGGFRYRVRLGDSLSEIAFSVYGDPQRWREIAAANPGIDTERLAAGQVLCVPLPSSGDGGSERSTVCP